MTVDIVQKPTSKLVLIADDLTISDLQTIVKTATQLGAPSDAAVRIQENSKTFIITWENTPYEMPGVPE